MTMQTAPTVATHGLDVLYTSKSWLVGYNVNVYAAEESAKRISPVSGDVRDLDCA